MAHGDIDYHARRAADERRLAERSGVPAAALAHLTLSRLHGARADEIGTRMSVTQ